MQQTPEQDWAAHIGITKEKAAELRRAHLEEGHGFVRRGRRIQLTEAGVGILGAVVMPGEKMAPAAPAAPPAPVHQTLWVERVTLNPHLILARTAKNGGQQVRLRVRQSKNFMPGMEVAKCLRLEGDVYSLDGNCPRWRGRW